METQKVIVYTPAQDFFMNTDFGSKCLLFAVCMVAATFCVVSISEHRSKPFNPWTIAGLILVGSVAFYNLATWALVHF